MSLNKVIVIIPVHKPALTQNELASLKQCYRILGSYPIRIVAPEGMDMSVYQNAVPGCESIFISPEWLSGIQQYNKLKISKYFYDFFKDYEYLLTYELDAWVFRDELLYWCDKGYDYIGAPWFEGYAFANNDNMIGVGNSGFSLRSIYKVCSILKRLERIRKMREIWSNSYLERITGFHNLIWKLKSLFKIKSVGNLNLILDPKLIQEDAFWAEIVPSFFKDYKMPAAEDAIPFSFEVNPSYLFKLNNEKLPFGCHAWEKHATDFWKVFIKEDFPVSFE